MGDCKVTVDPGICGLKTIIIAKPTEDMMGVDFEVESECPHVSEWAAKIGTVNPYEMMSQSMIDTPIYQKTKGVLPHSACPCPCAMIKSLEVAAGLGLKRDVNFEIRDARSKEASPLAPHVEGFHMGRFIFIYTEEIGPTFRHFSRFSPMYPIRSA